LSISDENLENTDLCGTLETSVDSIGKRQVGNLL
jgi:hypothetical protein